MYYKPFSSIFGEDSEDNINVKPGFLTQDENPVSVLKKEAVAETTPQNAPEISQESAEQPQVAPPQEPINPQQSIMDEMREQMEKLKEEKVYKPVDLPKKKLWSSFPPQFKATVAVESENPEVRLEQSTTRAQQKQQVFVSLEKKLDSLKNKTKAANTYQKLLISYLQLPENEKARINAWVKENNEQIKKLSSANRIKKTTEEAKDASNALDLEIEHWKNLSALKNKGADIKGSRRLLSLQPTGIQETKKELPKFVGSTTPSPMIKPVYQDLSGYGESIKPAADDLDQQQVDTKDLNKKIYEVFLDRFPKNSSLEYKQTRVASDLSKNIERNVAAIAETEWRIKNITSIINSQIKVFNEIQSKTKSIIDKLRDQDKNVASTLAIVVETKPDKFIESPSIIESLNLSLRNLSTLGDNTPAPSSPEVQNALLNQAAVGAESAIKELEAKQATLETIKASVEDRQPVIAPPVAKEKSKNSIIRTLNILLPAIAGAWILLKLLGWVK